MRNQINIQCSESDMLYVPIKDTNLLRLGELAFECKEYLEQYKKCDRTMHEAAMELSTSRPKLFTFLRKIGIIKGKEICPEYMALGYFSERNYNVSNGDFNKSVNLISVTPKGMKMLTELIKLLNPSQL